MLLGEMSLSNFEMVRHCTSLLQRAQRSNDVDCQRVAEMLNALPDEAACDGVVHPFASFVPSTDAFEQRRELKELPRYLKAKALLDCHEFQRCAAVFLPATLSEHTIQPLRSTNSPDKGNSLAFLRKGISQKALFLALYALLMVGEKVKTEQLGHILGPSDTGALINTQLVPLKHVLDAW